MLELNRRRLVLRFDGHVWEVQQTKIGCIALGDLELIPVPASWHLIRDACTISMPKNGKDETFAEFISRIGD